jgi:hypothetical protein
VIEGDRSYADGSEPDFPYDPDDTVYLGAGNDVYGAGDNAGFGDDLVRGGAGDDRLTMPYFGDVTAYGDRGDDIIDIRDGDPDSFSGDTAYGGDGADLIYSDRGDTVSGGAGQDSFHVNQDYCGTGLSTIITDYEPGESIEVFLTYHPNPGLQTITTTPSEDGQSQILRSGGFSIMLQGITEPIDVEVLIRSEYDVDPDFFCD